MTSSSSIICLPLVSQGAVSYNLKVLTQQRRHGLRTLTQKQNSRIFSTNNDNNNNSFPHYPLLDAKQKGQEPQKSAVVLPKRPSWWTDNWKILTTTTQQQPALTSQTTTHHSNQHHHHHQQQQQQHIVHYIKGGLPCDVHNVPKFQLSNYGKEALYTLVLLRHGESEWNLENKYTGWCDVNLTERGRQEARDAGRLLRENDIDIDHAFTSYLQRACFTTNMALNTSKQHWVPVTKSWRLNERHYGALQGYNKDTAWADLGLDQELVMEMRRSYDVRPPLMTDDHPHWHGADRRYKTLSQEQFDHSRGESLKDAAHRILPFYKSVIIPSLQAGNKCLVVSHANTLRTLIKFIDSISDDDIKGMSIPTGIPLLYRLDANFKPVCPFEAIELTQETFAKGYTWATSRRYGFNGVYLGDFSRLQEIQRKRDVTNRDWQRIILRNIAKSLLLLNKNTTSTATTYDAFTSNDAFSAAVIIDRLKNNINNTHITTNNEQQQQVMDMRQLWWKIRAKMSEKSEFSNMMLLSRMMEYLEDVMTKRRKNGSRSITMTAFEKVLNEIHLDTSGKVVEPFEELSSSITTKRNEDDDGDDDYTIYDR